MNKTPKEQPKSQPQQPEKMPPIRKITPEERGQQNGDGKKQKLDYNLNSKPNKIPPPTPEKATTRRFD